MNRRILLGLIAGTLAAAPRLAHAVPRAPTPLRRLHLVNPHTGETFDGVYRNDAGPIAPVMAQLSEFFRDFHSGSTVAMDVAVVDFLAAVMAATGQTGATVLSAYRTPATNAMLARTTFGVAENSQHMYGRALDVHFDRDLAGAMQAAREMRRGGVGWYPHSGFMHIDSGPVRNWDLDEGGLGTLLFDGAPLRFDQHGELTINVNGRRLPLMLRSRRPLTVRERLVRRRLFARAEFLQRRR
jgi:uncharacterized protein YcbK (DUF882 family)